MNLTQTLAESYLGPGAGNFAAEAMALIEEEKARSAAEGDTSPPDFHALTQYVRIARYVRARPWIVPTVIIISVAGLIALGSLIRKKM